MKHIVLTGGGSAGHVTPHLAIIEQLEKQSEKAAIFSYIGSRNGIEKELIEKTSIPYFSISTGKWRRYFSLENLTDLLKNSKGVWEAYFLLGKLKPDLVFSKGGFVSVPVVAAAKLRGINVILHESDMTPGLANKLSSRFADKIFTTFEETLDFLPKEKGMVVGSPVRPAMLEGNMERARTFLQFKQNKPIILIMGGSLGSHTMNTLIRGNLTDLLTRFQIVHLCGKGHLDHSLAGIDGYKQYEYLSNELPDLLKASSIIITRAGSNVIFECLALQKPMLLIPLTKKQSRGDQILNAKAFEKAGFAMVLEEERMTRKNFLNAVHELYEQRGMYHEKMAQAPYQNGLMNIIDCLLKMK